MSYPLSYPPVRYQGDGGEVSARFRSAEQEPDLTTAVTTVHYLATTAATDGEFGLYRWNMSAEPSGPSPHFHRTMSESFFVLSGTVRLFDGTRWLDAAPGDFLHVPVGGIHGFRNESGAPASMLLLFAPGAPRERYFEGLAEFAATGRRLTDEERTEFLRQHDQYMV
jgi:mannose-6-phosphate isomerase-like protein (cupin superfamily)